MTDRNYIISTWKCWRCGHINDWLMVYCVKCFPNGVFGERANDPKLTFKVPSEKESG